MPESTTSVPARKADLEELLRRLNESRLHLEEANEDPTSVTSLAIAVEILADVLADALSRFAPDASEEPSISAEAALELIDWPKPPTSAERVLFGDFGPVRHTLVAAAEAIEIHCHRCRALVPDSADICTGCGAAQLSF